MMEGRDGRVLTPGEMLENLLKNKSMRPALIIATILLFLLFLKPWVQIGAGERGLC